MSTGIFELSIVILIAAGLGIAARIFKQPIILAYIFSGVAIGIFGFFHLTNKDLFQIFSEMGLMFLLFLTTILTRRRLKMQRCFLFY